MGKRIRKILVVDDSPIILSCLEMVLTTAGYKVEQAEDGMEALKKVKAKNYDLLIVDISMPRMDGLSFIREAKKISWYIITPIIILTALDDPKMMLESKKLGVNRWMNKPFDSKQLVTAIQDILKGRFEHNKFGDVFFLKGSFNEFTDFRSLQTKLENSGNKVVIDLKEVKTINSFGIRGWVNFINALQVPVTLRNCSVPMTDQLSMIPEALTEKCQVASLFVAYYCTDCDMELDVKVVPDRDFPDNKGYRAPFKLCPECNHRVDLMMGDENYFSFLKENREVQKKIAKCSQWQERKPFYSIVKVLDGENQQSLGEGFSRDISRDGMYIVIQSPIPSGKEVILQFQIPRGGKHYETRGVVRWLKEDDKNKGIGVMFSEPDPKLIKEIENYIENYYG